jgi:HAD superfamily hydrolase (TIGR01459 family)
MTSPRPLSAEPPPPVHLPAGLAELAPAFDVLLCDVWGVLHNGATAHAGAGVALTALRREGRTVILVSNAPRPGPDVVSQLDGLGVPRAAFDAIVTSGDLTRALIADRAGQPVLHIGPPRDLPLFAGQNAPFADAENAAYCVCSGLLDDEVETAASYAPVLERMAARGLTMICANPDLVVERGPRLIPCAGAIAELYAAMGGAVIHAGKPHRPVYERALAMAAALRGVDAPLERVMAVGDAIRTDIAGAAGIGVASLLLLDGIHWHDVTGHAAGAGGWRDQIGRWLADQTHQPSAVMERLVW